MQNFAGPKGVNDGEQNYNKNHISVPVFGHSGRGR
jgi:hypothetical protein